MRTVALLCGLLLALPSIAAAQIDFSALTLRAGDSIYVTRVSGEKAQGVITQASASQLSLNTGATVTLDDVVKIERLGDPLKNGAVIGAVVLGGWCAGVAGQGVSSGGEFMMAVAANAGLGALIGAFIDRGHVGRTTVFKRSPSVHIAPALTSQQRGLAVSLSF